MLPRHGQLHRGRRLRDLRSNVYVAKSVSVPANAAESTGLFFQPSDNGGLGYYTIMSMSCSLPPNVGIHDTYVGYVVDDA